MTNFCSLHTNHDNDNMIRTNCALVLAHSQWHCPKCKAPRDAEKKMDVWIAPPVFIVHLKRFQDNSMGRRSKIDTTVDFPTQNLDLSKFMFSK
jgi:ubiquitin C-terminal hydrolase